MRLMVAVFIGKLLALITKFLKIGGGSAAPGLYALKIYPELLEELNRKISKNIVITGTNGKTTTAKMLAHFAAASGLRIIRNHTGSNLERGIASTLISCLNPWGCKLNFDLGIWELDEAAFNVVTPKLQPDIVVFLNIFRDQLDRYGEVDTVLKNWCNTLKKLDKKTIVLVNGDDTNTSKLAEYFEGSVQTFGVKDFKIIGESGKHSIREGDLDFEAKNVKLNGLKETSFQLPIVNSKFSISLPLPGIYHIYDFLAAFAAGTHLDFKPEQMISSLKDYSPAFGRVEKLPFGYIFLIKNPAGATQVFETLAPNLKPTDVLLVALNDNIADGRDVSWIWDADFEKLKVQNSNLPAGKAGLKIIVSGTRANDLAVRLKYAGFDPKEIYVEQSLEKAFKEARRHLKGHLFILPTYTALLAFQSILVKSGIKKHYWEEE